MKFAKKATIIGIIFAQSFCAFAGTVTFVNKSGEMLYIWPVPVGAPAAMAAQMPPYALPAQFSMDDSFSDMYVVTGSMLKTQVLMTQQVKLTDGSGRTVSQTSKVAGVDTIHDPAATVAWLNAKLAEVNAATDINPGITKLSTKKTWTAFDGYFGPWFAEEIVSY